MARVRRARYLCFFCDDFPFLDVDQLLRGTVVPVTARQVYALSVLRGELVELSADEFELAATTPSAEWVEPEDADKARRLALKGVLLSDEDDEELASLRNRHESLERINWNLHAALYFFLTKWRGIDLRQLSGQDPMADLLPPTDEAVRQLVDLFGQPPTAFPVVPKPVALHELPLVERDGDLYDVLLRRRTTRSFDSEPLGLDELAVVLRYVFGYHGYAPLFGEVTTLKRTSPSAGGFHPVEAYPLVTNVAGVDPGVYHYDARAHALELIAPLSHDEARATAAEFVCGQTYFADAHVLFVLAARFDRAFWKYRNHPKAFGALLMDAAHLSQTLYLVATELRLGAFVTAAINNVDIEERLGLDGYREGVLAVSGCGRPATVPSPFDPEFVPLSPREPLPR
jgi:putative peptide maturation dehydrogenase